MVLAAATFLGVVKDMHSDWRCPLFLLLPALHSVPSFGPHQHLIIRGRGLNKLQFAKLMARNVFRYERSVATLT